MNTDRTDESRLRSVSPLQECVEQELKNYFATLDGQVPCDIHKMVMGEAEQALFSYILEYTAGNQSKAAEFLGINRGTLRKKLKQYGLG